MRILLLVLWALIPVGVIAYHLGPGQDQLKLDQASQLLIEADTLVAGSEWNEAQLKLEKALALIPDDRTELRTKLQLKRAQVQMNNGQLPTAYQDLKSIVSGLTESKEANPDLLEQARLSLANSQYFMTWLKRLEGLSRDEWEPDVLAAQQNFRLLAKDAENEDDVEQLERYKFDLEATVKLARLDLGELQGLPLPSQ